MPAKIRACTSVGNASRPNSADCDATFAGDERLCGDVTPRPVALLLVAGGGDNGLRLISEVAPWVGGDRRAEDSDRVDKDLFLLSSLWTCVGQQADFLHCRHLPSFLSHTWVPQLDIASFFSPFSVRAYTHTRGITRPACMTEKNLCKQKARVSHIQSVHLDLLEKKKTLQHKRFFLSAELDVSSVTRADIRAGGIFESSGSVCHVALKCD
jgi:hypothetical protein